MKPLLIQRPARRDLREAASWYRERNVEVGKRFVAEVERTFELIERFPATGARVPLVAGPARRLPVNDFPYHVVFEEFPIASRYLPLLMIGDVRATGAPNLLLT